MTGQNSQKKLESVCKIYRGAIDKPGKIRYTFHKENILFETCPLSGSCEAGKVVYNVGEELRESWTLINRAEVFRIVEELCTCRL